MISRWLEFEQPIVELEERIEELKRFTREKGINRSEEIRVLEERVRQLKMEIYNNLAPWEKTQMSRHPKRPYTLDYVSRIFDDFVELHGDRCFGDDLAVVGGLGSLEGRPVVLIGHQKGREMKERQLRNFGCASPEGYRKAMRLMKLANKFGMPLISFIDTPAAAALIEAEERGEAFAIAESMHTMVQLSVPVVVVIIGEGGSGGAIAMGVGNRVLMLEYAIYSVIPPEGCAAIIWRDSKKAPEAASALCLTAQDLHNLGLIDEIILEPLGGAHSDYNEIAERVKASILSNLEELVRIPGDELVERRYQKFRSMGVIIED